MDDDVLPAALDRLVERGVLDRAQADAVLTETAAPARTASPGMRRLLGEIAGYLGASFVVGATLLLLGDKWDVLGRGGRVAILAAMAAILFAVGAGVRLLRRGPADDVRRRLASTLTTGSAAAAAFAVYVLLVPENSFGSDVEPAEVGGSVAGLLVAAAGYLLARSAFGQLGMAVGAFAVYASVLDLSDVNDGVPLGVGSVALGVLWVVLLWRRLLPERRAALAIALTFGLLGAQVPVIDDANMLGYLLTALVAAAAFTAYSSMREWILLAGGVAGATLVVPEFLWDVTDGSLGAAGVMLVAGVTLLAGSLAGLRFRRSAP